MKDEEHEGDEDATEPLQTVRFAHLSSGLAGSTRNRNERCHGLARPLHPSSFILPPPAPLLHRHTLGQMTGLVDVAAAGHGDVVGQ
jgi:hypothetical protein